jgi:YVTN family beta-propeller protein
MSFRKTFVLLAAGTLVLGLASATNAPSIDPPGFVFIANQYEHTAVLVDLRTNSTVARVEVGVNGHEVAVSPDMHFGYVPIYGNSGVGKPGTDGDRIDIIDLKEHKLVGNIPMGKAVRPHCAKFGPDGFLYVSAEVAQAIYVVDVKAKKVVGEIPTGATETHMFVLSPDGRRAYTSNVHAGSVSVLDLEKRALITVIPVSKIVQRISITADGKRVFTHDQDAPRIAVIDTTTNKISGWIPVSATVYSSTPLPDGHAMVASSPSGKFFSIDLDNLKQSGEAEACAALGEIALSHDGNRAFLTCPATGQLMVFNARNGKPDPEIMLTKGVDGIQWIPAIQ